VFLAGFLVLHAGVREKLLILPRQEPSSLSKSNRELSFVFARVVAQAKILTQARAVSFKRELLA